jgi:ATP-binding cassette subfamily B protein
MRWLGRFITQYRFAVFASLVYGAVGGITLALEPYYIGIIVDHVRAGVDLGEIARDIFLLLGLAVVTVAAFFGQRHYSGLVAYGVQYDVRRTIFHHMVTLDQGFYQRYPVGDLISRMHSDMEWIWRLLALGFTRGGSAIVGCVVTFILLGMINLPLTLVVFTTLAISTYFQMRAGLALIKLSEDVQDQAGVVSALVQDATSGIQTIKTFGREAHVSQKFYEENREYRRRWLYFKRRNEPVGMLPQMIAHLTTGIVVIFGGTMALNEQITIGNFTQFLLYLAMISNVLLQIGTIYQRFQQTRGAIKRLTPLLQTPDIRDTEASVPLTHPKGTIQFENVSLKAEDKYLLRNITLDIPAGKVIGVVGPTGCGKTLLVSLLARVMDPAEGKICIDGLDVRHIKLDDLRQAIAYVPQETFLFSLPLHENVRMGRPNLDEEEIMRAVHISRLSNDLPQLPDGMETLVGEKGVMLSGGQKQRVAIARAIAHDPAILVLDDALSSVDTQTAADILHDLRDVLRSRTSLIIAHRIATVKDADIIIVMDNGRIVEHGTHASLIAHDGMYARMVERELKEDAAQHSQEILA